jgi:4'-phosphopantetheinyl transferase
MDLPLNHRAQAGDDRDAAVVWVAWLEPPDAVRSMLGDILAPAERERATRYVFERDRRRFVAAHAFLRLLLSSELDARPAAVEIDTGPHGKPSLAWPLNLQFNLSHSGDLAVCAIVRGTDQVGVDVEYVRPLDDLDAVARAALSAAELARFEALAGPERLPAFYDAWTRKEALLKASGHGFARSPQEVEVGIEPSWSARSRAVGGDGDAAWLHGFEPRAGYVGALAVLGAPRGVRMRSWTWA